jgi:hypothetical protein
VVVAVGLVVVEPRTGQRVGPSGEDETGCDRGRDEAEAPRRPCAGEHQPRQPRQNPSTWTLATANQTMKLSLCNPSTIPRPLSGPSTSSETPVPSTPTVAATSSGASARITMCGGPRRTYAAVRE